MFSIYLTLILFDLERQRRACHRNELTNSEDPASPRDEDCEFDHRHRQSLLELFVEHLTSFASQCHDGQSERQLNQIPFLGENFGRSGTGCSFEL